MRFVNWLNQNQGVVMAMLTFVYVAATIVIAGLSVKGARLAQKNIETMIDLERNRLRPYVLFNLSSSIAKRCTYESVKNHGLTAAYNVKVSIEPPLMHHHDGQSPLTHRDILFLPPSEQVLLAGRQAIIKVPLHLPPHNVKLPARTTVKARSVGLAMVGKGTAHLFVPATEQGGKPTAKSLA